jgi:hypothetical protein
MDTYKIASFNFHTIIGLSLYDYSLLRIFSILQSSILKTFIMSSFFNISSMFGSLKQGDSDTSTFHGEVENHSEHVLKNLKLPSFNDKP